MLEAFLDSALAGVDDLYELKVTLVALRMLDRKQTGTASVTARELAAEPVLRESFGALLQPRLDFALNSAAARGTLLRTTALNEREARYFANTPASRAAIEAIERAVAEADRTARRAHTEADHARQAVFAEMARLECVEAYPATSDDAALVEEWVGRGYAVEQIVAAARDALRHPRVKGSPPRVLAQFAKSVESQPPAQPTDYYRAVIRGAMPSFALNDALVFFEAKWRRRPDAHEFNVLQAAIGLFGHAAVLDGLGRVARDQNGNLNALIPLLAESEDAAMALARKDAAPEDDGFARELQQLHEAHLGLPPTAFALDEMRAIAQEQRDIEVWRAAFKYAAAQNKRSWGFVKWLVRNPTPDLFTPEPVNDAAKSAFDEYRRRVGRGSLDASVAREINALATSVTDKAKWTEAFDKAAKANALNWNYIKAVLSGEARPKPGAAHARQKASPGQAKRTYRRPQVEYTEEDRRAAEERARAQLAEREKQRGGGAGGNG